MAAVLKHAWYRLRHDGLKATLNYSRIWCSEEFHDKRYGISTRKCVDPIAFGYGENYHQHDAAPYSDLKRIFAALDFDENGNEVFVDYGSGAGRVVLMAGMLLPFKTVIGVELLPSLIDLAKQNRQRVKKQLLCDDIRFVESDATAYKLPPDSTKVFFFNPFSGAILEKALDNIRESVVASPRTLTIVFVNHGEVQSIIDQRPWIVPVKSVDGLRYTCQFYQIDVT